MKKKSVLIIALVLLVAIVAVICICIFNNNDEDNEKSEKNNAVRSSKWYNSYVKYINDKKTFEDVKDIKIQLADIDNDRIPELIFYGTKSVGESFIRIQKFVNNETKLIIDSTVTGGAQLQYAYSLKDEEYNWYLVNQENQSVNKLDITDSYINLYGEYGSLSDFVIPNEEKNVPISIDIELSEEEIENKFNEISNNYVENTKIVTKEFEEKIEAAKTISKLPLINEDYPIVYNADKILEFSGNYDNNQIVYYYQYPKINIDNTEIKRINDEIKEKYGFTTENKDTLLYDEIEVESYFAFLNGDILSVVPFKGGNSSTWSSSYNIDLKKLELINNADLIPNECDMDEVIEKLKDFGKALEEKNKEGFTESAEFVQAADEAYEAFEKVLDEKDFDNIYLNEDGDACLRVELEVLGGQFTCTKILEINLSKNDSEVEEFDSEDYISKDIAPKRNFSNDYITEPPADSFEMSQYIGKDIVETSKKLNMKKSNNSYFGETYDDEYSTASFIASNKADGSITRCEIDKKKYNVYGITVGMNYESARDILLNTGNVESEERSGYVSTVFRMKDGNTVIINTNSIVSKFNDKVSSISIYIN